MADPVHTFEAWLVEQRGQDGGTHYDGCYKAHPGCAAIIAEGRVVDAARRMADEIITQPLAGYVTETQKLRAGILRRFANQIEKGIR